ncbi:hypothetical protein MMPV_001875 [Pyropia vietnamensis]
MDMLGVVARLNTVSADTVIQWLSDVAVDEWLLGGSVAGGPMSLPRRLVLTWLFTYVGGLGLYYLVATADFLLVFFALRRWLVPDYLPDWPSVRREVAYSTRSLAVMAAMTTPTEVAIQLGYSRVYHDPAEFGWAYLVASPFLFLLFTDSVIYWVHRGLHHRWIYKYVHKPHHSFVQTTPYAAFAFHPLDGYLQGVAYQAFVFVFPFQAALHMASLAFVAMWTINIHDRVSFGLPGVNGARHHTVHHLTFKANYGQYFTFWDWVCGTWRDPDSLGVGEKEATASPQLVEEQVYGKKYL